MNMPTRLEIRQISDLHPYERNARIHSPAQIEQLRRSMREFGFVTPLLIDGAGNVIAGHGRLLAAAAEGITEAPCVLVDHLTDAQRRAYILADNRLAESATWDEALVSGELLSLRGEGVDIVLTGFDAGAIVLTDEPEPSGHFWDQEAEPTEESVAFESKFAPKKTTDDCYTPANIYEAARAWVVDRYGLQDREILRPFYPGGDYQAADYPEGSVVIDNPPFSILSEICAWYEDRAVPYFLFAPGLTLFSINAGRSRYLPVGLSVMYENGAQIATSFVTNLGDLRIEIAPDLYAALDAANTVNLRAAHAEVPNYTYPAALCNVAMNKLAKYGQALRIPDADAAFVRALDAQRPTGKSIYGGGFLLSEKAAAEKAAAEKAAAEKTSATVWALSDRELALIASLGGDCHA